ncbi:MAG: M3 family oligoendopeptidase [Bacteroidales bacterium]|nr:M3 family oligoendopeptidase [Bacteroidales bacterium]
MTSLLREKRKNRRFVSSQLIVETWKDVEPYYVDLETRRLNDAVDLTKWLLDRSELESILEEDAAWRYIKMNCDTVKKELADSFNYFVMEIEPQINKYSNILDAKVYSSRLLDKIDQNKYFIYVRSLKKRMEIFRENNLPLIAQLQKDEQEYGTISSQMTIHYDDKELTLQQAANYLRDIDREVRQEVYELICKRRDKEIDRFNEIFDNLVKKRHQVALNADFRNFRDYRFDALGRFDYNADDCFQFHQSIFHEVCPIVDEMHKRRKAKLELRILKPWDLEVDTDRKDPLKPFLNSRELINKTIQCFREIRPKYAEFLKIMDKNGYLDLDSRIGKAPGGFNYPLYESNVPFVFMNSAGNLRDLETMVHEGGHAIHSFLSKDIELVDYKNVPAEVAELASMSMELISMEHWGVFFPNREDLLRAKRSQLEGIIKILPWIASIDKFQHWLYLNPNHSITDREQSWKEIYTAYGSSNIDWRGQETSFNNQWQRQLHIFNYPFYYIEYGIAQLGAISIWHNYKNDREKTLNEFEAALRLGYSVPISEIYETAGIKFNFSREYIHELMTFVQRELEAMEQ